MIARRHLLFIRHSPDDNDFGTRQAQDLRQGCSLLYGRAAARQEVWICHLKDNSLAGTVCNMCSAAAAWVRSTWQRTPPSTARSPSRSSERKPPPILRLRKPKKPRASSSASCE